VATAITAFFYLRIVVVMYFSEPAAEMGGLAAGGRSSAMGSDAPYVVVPGLLTVAVITVAVVLTLGLGLWPGPVLDLLTVPLPLLS